MKCPIKNIAEAINKAGIPFLVIGGYAVMAHGHVRTTEDLDLLVPQERRADLSGMFHNLGMTTKNDAATFLQLSPQDESEMNVDLMFVAGDVFSRMQQASVETMVEGIPVRVVSLPHLMALKCHALKHSQSIRRLKDMDDLIQLVLIHRLDLNEPELRATILKHGDAEIYEKLRHACAD